MSPQRIILDCDPGMDDSMAIILAAKSPAIQLQAVTTTHGNYSAEVTAANARKVLELLGLHDIPVAAGAQGPLVRPCPADPFSHGDDGQAGNNLPVPTMPLDSRTSAQLIVDEVNRHPGELILVMTGPMTNLALALRLDPSISTKIKRIVAISGAFGINDCAYKNATGDNPLSEWNVYVDPEAAKIVYESQTPLLAIGLDVATYFDVDFTDLDIESLNASGLPEAKFLTTAINFVRGRGYDAYCTVIDCMAVAAVIDPRIVSSVPGLVGIETQGELTRGMTVWDRRHHHEWSHLPTVDIATSADYSQFLNLLTATLLQGR